MALRPGEPSEEQRRIEEVSGERRAEEGDRGDVAGYESSEGLRVYPTRRPRGEVRRHVEDQSGRERGSSHAQRSDLHTPQEESQIDDQREGGINDRIEPPAKEDS